MEWVQYWDRHHGRHFARKTLRKIKDEEERYIYLIKSLTYVYLLHTLTYEFASYFNKYICFTDFELQDENFQSTTAPCQSTLSELLVFLQWQPCQLLCLQTISTRLVSQFNRGKLSICIFIDSHSYLNLYLYFLICVESWLRPYLLLLSCCFVVEWYYSVIHSYLYSYYSWYLCLYLSLYFQLHLYFKVTVAPIIALSGLTPPLLCLPSVGQSVIFCLFLH